MAGCTHAHAAFPETNVYTRRTPRFQTNVYTRRSPRFQTHKTRHSKRAIALEEIE